MATNERNVKRMVDVIDAASKHVRTMFYIYLGFISYCAITVFGTTDQQLIIKGERVVLPILDITVSLYGFFILAPIIAMILYVYFMVYLNRVNVLIKELRGYYEERHCHFYGKEIFPWMFNIARFPDEGWIGRIQYLLVWVSLWLTLPITIFLFLIKFIKKHDDIFSYIFVLLLFLSIFIVLCFRYELYKINMKKNIKNIYATVTIILLIVSCLAIALINKGYFGAAKYPRYKIWVNINLPNQILVKAPSIDNDDNDIEQKYWLDLVGENLNGADLSNAVLKKANMAGVKLDLPPYNKSIS